MSPRSGVTLAEAIVGLALAAFVILSAAALAISAITNNQKASDLQVGSVWAGQKLEEFVYDLPRFNHPFWTTSTFPSPYQTDAVTLGGTLFQGELFVSDLSAQGRGLRLVTVNVSWASGQLTHVGYGRQSTSVARVIYAH